jgi:hypothetical protein
VLADVTSETRDDVDDLLAHVRGARTSKPARPL